MGLQLTRVRNEKEKFSRKLKLLMKRKMELAVQIGQTSELSAQAERDLVLAESVKQFEIDGNGYAKVGIRAAF